MTKKANSERARGKAVGALAQSRGMGRDVGNLRTGEGMCTVQEASFHTAITKQSFGNGSSDRVFMWKPTHRTCKRTGVERPGYFSGLLSLERHAVKWQLCTTESWVAAAHPVCSHLTVHLRTGTVAYCTLCLITSLLWLPLAWMNRHTPFLSEIFW